MDNNNHKPQNVNVPDVGSSDPLEVIEVCVSVGEAVELEQTLIILESDKATVEIPSPAAGSIASVAVKVGDKLTEGDLIATLQSQAAQPATAPTAETKTETKAEPAAAPAKPAAASEAPAAEATSSTETIILPDIGDDNGAEIIEILVQAGDTISKEQPLMVLESDKATIEVPSPQAGTLSQLLVNIGDTIKQGTAIAELRVTGTSQAATQVTPEATPASAPAAEPQAPTQQAAAQTPVQPATPAAEAKAGAKVYAGPAARKLARELGVDIATVSGSGKDGRIVKDDIKQQAKQLITQQASAPVSASGSGLPVLPEMDFGKFGPVSEVSLSRIQRSSGANLHRAWLSIPHVTQFDEADITELESFRKSQNQILSKNPEGTKLTMLAFLVKAVAHTLKSFPQFRSSLHPNGEHLIEKDYYHIGIAVDTPNGLVVPVIRDADQKGVIEIAREMGELSAKARERKLTPAQMQGAVFSISSLGGIGGTAFTPIVNWPEVAILGVSRSQMKPQWNDQEFEPRLMLPLSLSYDHRVIDGADGARFSTSLATSLEDLKVVLL